MTICLAFYQGFYQILSQKQQREYSLPSPHGWLDDPIACQAIDANLLKFRRSFLSLWQLFKGEKPNLMYTMHEDTNQKIQLAKSQEDDKYHIPSSLIPATSKFQPACISMCLLAAMGGSEEFFRGNVTKVFPVFLCDQNTASFHGFRDGWELQKCSCDNITDPQKRTKFHQKITNAIKDLKLVDRNNILIATSDPCTEYKETIDLLHNNNLKMQGEVSLLKVVREGFLRKDWQKFLKEVTVAPGQP